jgi:hypothetical protein
MTRLSNASATLVRLWQMSALGIRNLFARITVGSCNQDAYPLHPRCCRNEHFWESQ